MKKVLISRYGAYGDIIHMSHLPRLLKDQGFDQVDVEVNWKGYQLLGDNPFIDHLYLYEPQPGSPMWLLEKHWQIISEPYDKFINLYQTLEYGVLAMEDTNEYYMSTQVRRNRWSNVNYYDATTIAAGYPHLQGKYQGELFNKAEEIKVVEDWMKQFEGKFVVMLNLSGTSAHKEFVQHREVADYILSNIPNSQVILTGGPDCKKESYEKDGVVSIVGKFPFRQAALIAKYVNLLISCESGIGCASSMWGTPTIQMMTAANITAHCKYAKNDYSIQSPVACSPCHKGPYKYNGCPSQNGKPKCVYFRLEQITEKIDAAYRETYRRLDAPVAAMSVL